MYMCMVEWGIGEASSQFGMFRRPLCIYKNMKIKKLLLQFPGSFDILEIIYANWVSWINSFMQNPFLISNEKGYNRRNPIITLMYCRGWTAFSQVDIFGRKLESTAEVNTRVGLLAGRSVVVCREKPIGSPEPIVKLSGVLRFSFAMIAALHLPWSEYLPRENWHIIHDSVLLSPKETLVITHSPLSL